jgi:CRISPR/Cas system CSM-associated protein Csm2 small subunit
MRMRTTIMWGAGLVVAAFAIWLALPSLKPLASLPANTKHLVSVTRDILVETKQLQARVTDVQENLQELGEQERLLSDQAQQMGLVLAQLKQQQALASDSTKLLTQILQTEQQTATITARASQASSASTKTVAANARVLEQLATATGRIQQGSERNNGQLDHMLDEMADSADNFAVIERLKKAVTQVEERARNWWDRVVEWFKR